MIDNLCFAVTKLIFSFSRFFLLFFASLENSLAFYVLVIASLELDDVLSIFIYWKIVSNFVCCGEAHEDFNSMETKLFIQEGRKDQRKINN